MAIIVESYPVPEKGPMDLNLQYSFEIKSTADEARRQVNHWLRNEVSMLLKAESPTLVIKECAVWRVPVVFSAPGVGQVRVVDAVDVDVVTGQMDIAPERKLNIERQAEALAKRLPPYRPLRESPMDYMAKAVPPAQKLILDENGYPIMVTSS